MPYVSPRGIVMSTIPIKPRPRPTPPALATAQPEILGKQTPSADLGDFNSRNLDAFLAQKLDHWTGWGAKHEVAGAEKEDIELLGEEVKDKVAEKATTKDTRPQKERKLPMRIELPSRIVTGPSKRAVSVNEIEVDERFIPDDLL